MGYKQFGNFKIGVLDAETNKIIYQPQKITIVTDTYAGFEY
jgi:hypothetical protein